jgi:hypothetical protein
MLKILLDESLVGSKPTLTSILFLFLASRYNRNKQSPIAFSRIEDITDLPASNACVRTSMQPLTIRVRAPLHLPD